MLHHQKGFTLLEMLVAVVIVGIIAAIASPRWMRFLEERRLVSATDQIYSAVREAQSQSQYKGTSWRLSVRERSDLIELAVHSNATPAALAKWEAIDAKAIQIDGETTFANSGGIYYVRFDSKGNVKYRLGRLTVSGRRFSTQKRCVIVSTLIGAVRQSKEQATLRDGKLCY